LNQYFLRLSIFKENCYWVWRSTQVYTKIYPRHVPPSIWVCCEWVTLCTCIFKLYCCRVWGHSSRYWWRFNYTDCQMPVVWVFNQFLKNLSNYVPVMITHTHARTHARTQARTQARTHARTHARMHFYKISNQLPLLVSYMHNMPIQNNYIYIYSQQID